MTAFSGVNGVYFNTYAKSAKARNLHRDPRFCCVVTSFASAGEREFVLLRGMARFVANSEPETFGDDDGIRRARMASPLAPSASGTADDPAEAERRRARAAERVAEGKRVVFELEPTYIGSPTSPGLWESGS